VALGALMVSYMDKAAAADRAFHRWFTRDGKTREADVRRLENQASYLTADIYSAWYKACRAIEAAGALDDHGFPPDPYDVLDVPQNFRLH
jgi:hypothetical protein